MANMTTSGSVSEFERVFGHLTTAEPQPERRLDVIVREGLARMDAAVEQVCKRYQWLGRGHAGDVYVGEVLAAKKAYYSNSPKKKAVTVYLTRGQLRAIRECSPWLIKSQHGYPQIYGLDVAFHESEFIGVS